MQSLSAFSWLIHGAIASTLLLALAAVAVTLCRQPADRVRIIQWSFAATLGTLILLAVPSFSAISLGVIHSRQAEPAQNTAVATAEVDGEAASQRIARDPALHEPLHAVLSTKIASDAEASASSAVESPRAAALERSPQSERDWIRQSIRAVCIAYALVCIALSIRLAVGLRKLLQIRRTASETPANVRAEWKRIAGDDADRVCLLASNVLDAPITWGVRRPVIVLPSSIIE